MQPVTPSSVDVDVTFRVLDATTFLPYESLTSATSGLALWYRKGSQGAVTGITEADHTNLTDAHSDGKIKHIDDGNYRLSLPDAAIPTAEHEVTVYGGTATGYVILGGAIVGKPVEVVSGALVAASVSGAVGSVTGAVGSVAAGGITAASIATGAVDADALAADAGAKLADIILRRTAANIEASANGDTLSVESVYGLVMAAFESAVSSTTWTIRQTGGSTLGTKTVAVDAAANPIVSVT